MCPLKVECDGQEVGVISAVGSVDLANPINPPSFGGRITYFSDQTGQVSFISPGGTETTQKIKPGETITHTFSVPDPYNVFGANAQIQYIVSTTRT